MSRDGWNGHMVRFVGRTEVQECDYKSSAGRAVAVLYQRQGGGYVRTLLR